MTAPARQPPRSAPVIVVGAGWAGLAAALELTAADVPTLLLESARQPGGRARAIDSGGSRLDNGQHLLIGAYRETLRLMQSVGLDPESALLRLPLDLQVTDGADRLRLTAPNLPAPLHLAAALLGAAGISWSERFAALHFGRYIAAGRTPDSDVTVRDLLTDQGQSQRITRRLWEPLCLAALNTPVDRASAHAFLKVLHDSFAHRRSDGDLLIPQRDLSALFPEPAVAAIRRRGGEVRFSEKVLGIQETDGRIGGVVTATGTLPARAVILAVPPQRAARLLQDLPQMAPTGADLDALAHESITTVYLRYDRARLPAPMLGLVGTTAQWLFDRRVVGDPNRLAAVISADGPHCRWSRQQLVDEVDAEVRRHVPGATLLDATVIREKRATFACTAGSAALRPAAGEHLPGLYLAGDHTATGYPATLEGAVISGVQCARNIVDNAALSPEAAR